MRIRKLFNMALFLFMIAVLLIPSKCKLGMIPLSVDFLFGSLLIILGLIKNTQR